MKRDPALVLTVLAPAVLGLTLLVLAGCGGGDQPLAWQSDPRLISAPKNERVLIGQVTNRSGKRVDVAAKSLQLLDAEDRSIPAAKAFISSFVKSNYPNNNGPARYPQKERLRLGIVAEIDPGKSVPLTISWHEPSGPRTPVRIGYGRGFLKVP